jgi:hypothetical protein
MCTILKFERPAPVKHARVPAAPLVPKTPTGMVDVYGGSNGMVGIDACVPRALADAILALIDKAGIVARA